MIDLGAEEKIRAVATEKFKEYFAYDRTLDALAALRAVLSTPEVQKELVRYDFRPRLARAASEADSPLKPDGLILLTGQRSYLIELKTSWDEKHPEQICKYAESSGWINDKGEVEPFGKSHSILLGYQKSVGPIRLDHLLHTVRGKTEIPFVVFHYALESGVEDSLHFAWLGHELNGICPDSQFGRLFNAAGFPVPASEFKFMRSKFDKANDEVIDSYAAIIWWNRYALFYPTNSQKSEMADQGRLTEPLRIRFDQVNDVPRPEGVEVGLDGDDVRRAFAFLLQAGLLKERKKGRFYEILLRTSIRLPLDAPSLGGEQSFQDTAHRIIMRWATYRVLRPVTHKQVKPRAKRRRGKSSPGTLPLPFPGSPTN